jgi:LysR family nod box-dependent transcriptional activator
MIYIAKLITGGPMNLAQVDLNLLVALDALIEEKHVTRAAERVGLSQPAMSSALARLRRMFADELLVRVGKEYRLTALATELQGPLQEFMQIAEETVQRRPHFDPASDERLFSIVASDYTAYILLQPLLQRVARDAPGIRLQIRWSSRGEPVKVTSDVNVGLWPSPDPTDTELPYEVLFHERWVCAVWKGNKIVGDEVGLEECMKLPHLVYGKGVGGMADPIHYLNLEGHRHIQASTESFFVLPFMLQGTDLIAFVHERLARMLADAAEIRVVEPLFETPPVAEAMYWHSRNTSDPAHVWLRSQLREIGARL